jgi:hypothetical protein
LFPGKIIGKEKDPKADVLGGISIVYDLKSGEEYENGIYDIRCTNHDMIDFPAVLDLKDNEYITAIYGTGTEFIKTLNIETNFYRKIKQGAKLKSEAPSPKVELQSFASSNQDN